MTYFEAQGLQKDFHLGGGFLAERRVVKAVSDVSFDVEKGTTLGIVGESGCGKSTTAKLIMGLVQRDAGDVRIGDKVIGRDLTQKASRRMMQMVFQDSFASLNPRMTIEASIMFGPQVHGTSKAVARARAHDLLDTVGLDPHRFAGRYPHELSGGQRQRVNIARALALEPQIVILDEAVSALDKSVEAQVLNLLIDLKGEFGLTYLFISHDLNVVQYIADRVMVMYLGRVVEIGPVEQLYASPRHPYTKALLRSMPSMNPKERTKEAPLRGDPPSPIDPPTGCHFHTRCPFAADICLSSAPDLSTEDHAVACHLAKEID